MVRFPEKRRSSDTPKKPLCTFSRRETKYELAHKIAERLQSVVQSHLPPYCFKTGRDTTYITTIYFDTESLDFYKRARFSYDNNFKIRAKEYSYQPKGGTWELSPNCFLEIKRRAEGHVLKRRICMPKKLLLPFVVGTDVWEGLVEANSGMGLEDCRDVYGEMRKLLQTFKIRARAVVNYRRRVYQLDAKSERSLRITFDDQISFFPPPEGLYDRLQTLNPRFTECRLPIHQVDKVIMEIKCQNAYPSWLQETLKHYLPERTSKFTTSINMLATEPRSGIELRSDLT